MYVTKNGVKQKILNDAQLAAYKKSGWLEYGSDEDEQPKSESQRGRGRPSRQEQTDGDE